MRDTRRWSARPSGCHRHRASSTSTVVVVIWAVVTPAFRNSGHYANPFTIDSYRDVY